MTKTKLYLHIGFEKSGSTAIQQYFFDNHKELEKIGIVYPTDKKSKLVFMNNHWPIAASFSEKNTFVNQKQVFDADYIRNYLVRLSEIKAGSTMVLSAEPFSSNVITQQGIDALGHALRDFDVKVVAYIRRQDSFFISHISNYVKGGQLLKLDNFIDMAGTHINYKVKDRYNFKLILGRWEKTFGLENMIIRPFERQQLHLGDVVTDFLKVLDVDILSLPEVNVIANESLCPEAMLFLNLLNIAAGPALLGKNRSRVFRQLEKLKTKRPKQQIITNEHRNQIIDLYERSNKSVAKRYLGNKSVLFKDERPDVRQVIPPFTPLSYSELKEIAEFLDVIGDDITESIIAALCRESSEMGPLYGFAQKELLSVYAPMKIADKFQIKIPSNK